MKKSKIEEIKIHISEKWDLRYNLVNNRLLYRRKDSEDQKWEQLNENNILIELLENHFSVSSAVLMSLLKSDFVEKFNPFTEYLESLGKWDGKIDFINELAKYIHVVDKDKDRFLVQFKKMFVRTLASALEIQLNKQAFIFVHSKQNSGKSTFFRWLCPPRLQEYYTEDIEINKDGEIALAENFIINLDELSILSKKDLNSLKSYMSKDTINKRLPYEKSTSLLRRRCSFVGSTNSDEFLSDPTGSVRWVCFELKEINWDYKKDIDINKIWRQAYSLLKSGFDYKMSRSEIQENDIANRQFMIRTKEFEFLQYYFRPAKENTPNAEFLTASDIMKDLQDRLENSVKFSDTMIGKALIALGYEKISKYMPENRDSVKGYYVLKINGYTNGQDPLLSSVDEMPNLPF